MIIKIKKIASSRMPAKQAGIIGGADAKVSMRNCIIDPRRFTGKTVNQISLGRWGAYLRRPFGAISRTKT
jgi:hypothetical protein